VCRGRAGGGGNGCDGLRLLVLLPLDHFEVPAECAGRTRWYGAGPLTVNPRGQPLTGFPVSALMTGSGGLGGRARDAALRGAHGLRDGAESGG
jgi:hypothetical protein